MLAPPHAGSGSRRAAAWPLLALGRERQCEREDGAAGRELTSSVPSIRRASSRAIASPSPEPWPESLVWKRSNTCASSRLRIPGPSSADQQLGDGRRRGSRRARATIETVVPVGRVHAGHCPPTRARSVPFAPGRRSPPRRPRRRGRRRRSSRPCARRRQRTRPTTWFASVRSGTGSSSSSSESASSRERSSRSVVSFCSRSTCSRIVVRNSSRVCVVELLVLEQLHEAAEREDRRAQLVRCVRDELLARGVEPREPALHLVERLRQLAQLVVRVDRDRVGEVAGRDLARRPARGA